MPPPPPTGYPGQGATNYAAASATGGMPAPGMPGMPPPPGGGGTSATKSPSTPGSGNSKKSPSIEAAEKFLDALKDKDLQKLQDAIALRAPLQAAVKHRPIFANIRDGQLDEATLTELSEAFDEMKVAGMNTPKSTGLRGVIVSKTEKEKNEMVSRTIYVRREVAGWKVLDFSGPHIRSSFGNSYRKRK